MGEQIRETLLAKGNHHDDHIWNFSAAEDPKAAEQFTLTMGVGFATEPNNDFYCPDPALNIRRWEIIAANVLKRKLHLRALYGTGPGFGAVAMSYIYPDEEAPKDSPEPPGIVDLAPYTRPETIPARDAMFGFMAEGKTQFSKTHGSFQYISFLATRPELQGKGYGSRLMRHLTNMADREGRWCYLEATNARNARLYERHGFLPLGPPGEWSLESLPGKKVILIPMARPPRAETARGEGGAGAAERRPVPDDPPAAAPAVVEGLREAVEAAAVGQGPEENGGEGAKHVTSGTVT